MLASLHAVVIGALILTAVLISLYAAGALRSKPTDVSAPTQPHTRNSHPHAAGKEAQLLEALTHKAPHVDLAQVRKALELIRVHHAPQRRERGEPFYWHPIAVALLLLERNQDQDALLAALLHDTVEDTTLTLDQISQHFNPTVAFLVDAVTKKRSINLARSLKNLHSQDDPRALELKIADRLHNMQTLQAHPSHKKQRRIAEDTRNLFVPLAYQLGWHEAASRLEHLAAQALARQQ